MQIQADINEFFIETFLIFLFSLEMWNIVIMLGLAEWQISQSTHVPFFLKSIALGWSTEESCSWENTSKYGMFCTLVKAVYFCLIKFAVRQKSLEGRIVIPCL